MSIILIGFIVKIFVYVFVPYKYVLNRPIQKLRNCSNKLPRPWNAKTIFKEHEWIFVSKSLTLPFLQNASVKFFLTIEEAKEIVN